MLLIKSTIVKVANNYRARVEISGWIGVYTPVDKELSKQPYKT